MNQLERTFLIALAIGAWVYVIVVPVMEPAFASIFGVEVGKILSYGADFTGSVLIFNYLSKRLKS